MKKQIVSSIFFLLTTTIFAQNTIYVSQNANAGLQNGSSWQNAFADLQEALAVAEYGDSIWIATGVYYPTATTDRHISFQLKNGVSILGGFNGTENNAVDRDPGLFPTRLSGNIGDTTLQMDNSAHVAVGKGLDETTRIDGLIFSDAYSIALYDFPADPYGAGMYLTGSAGLVISRPVISNCIFEKNYAGTAGGAMYISNTDFDDPAQLEHKINPVLKNCTFIENWANDSGGAILRDGVIEVSDTFKLVNCNFSSNYAQLGHGGGVYFSGTFGSNFLIKNCAFYDNISNGGSGGGICLLTDAPGNYITSVTIQDCIFDNNSAVEGGGFSIDGRFSDAPGVMINLSVFDCIFEKNISTLSYGSAFLVTHVKDGIVNATLKSTVFSKNTAGGFFTSAILGDDDCVFDVLLEDCTFLENVHTGNPLTYCAAFSVGGLKNIQTRINNCLFAYNGSAFFAGGGEMGKVNTEITNCTFFRNGNRPFGKRWYPSFNFGGGTGYFNNMSFKNCVIWEPVKNNSYLFDNNYPDQITGFGFFLDYCSLHPMNPAVVPNASTVFRDSIYIGEYPLFLDTLALDFRLDKCSFAVNKGQNEAAQNAGLLEDLDEQARIRFGRVDLGAYEQQDSCFVSASKNPINLHALAIMPNPSYDGTLSFELPAFIGKSGTIKLFGIDGRLVFEAPIQVESNIALRLHALAAGTYYVLVRLGDTAFSGKWIVIK